MKIFSADYLDGLTVQARVSLRRRQHRNIHESYDEPCQRLFNAIEPESYIRPHRHENDPKGELLIGIRGEMALVTFDGLGSVLQVVRFGSEKYNSLLSIGAEVPRGAWHTVVSLVAGSVLLEVKSGPFDQNHPKEHASWAPDEGTEGADRYLKDLIRKISGCI